MDMSLAEIKKRLSSATGLKYWRSLEQIADTDTFRRHVENEFAVKLPGWNDPFSRRRFLQLMASSFALAGLAGCTKMPIEKIIPYVIPPDKITPGQPLFFATAMPFYGYARGILVESHMGRPTKIEGNPKHPDSLGATDAITQASVLDLYDPDRSQTVANLGVLSTWNEFQAELQKVLEAQDAKKGAGIRLLTETVTSPSLAAQIGDFLKKYPEAHWHAYQPVNRDLAHKGTRMAFGQPLDAQYRFDKAKVVLSLDADFLSSRPGSVRYAKDFSRARNARKGDFRMSRLYAVESGYSLTGAKADHRLPAPPSKILPVAAFIASKLGLSYPSAGLEASEEKWAAAAARDLLRHKGAGLVVAGEETPAEVQALAHAMNAKLGNIGKTVVYTAPIELSPLEQTGSLKELAQAMNAGEVDALFILGGNPVFYAPADLSFENAMKKARFRVHLGAFEDETSFYSDWHIPEAHYLESWGDVRAFDGTVSVIQPLIAPLYDGKSAPEIMSVLNGQSRSGYEIVKDYWKNRSGAANFDKDWEAVLRDGFVPDTAEPLKNPALKNFSLEKSEPAGKGVEIIFRPDPSIGDGRYDNNGWLQELPKPFTKLTWDNAALVAPAMAERLRLENGDLVEITQAGRSLVTPVWILPGHADDSVTLNFGYGRSRTGKVGSGTGFNVYAIRNAESPWTAAGARIQKLGKRHVLAATDLHHSMEGRDLAREGSLEEFRRRPDFASRPSEEAPVMQSLYPDRRYDGYAWGMVINLNACIGCNACVVACQSENNIPIVGKAEVLNGREMHWIRIDDYFTGDVERPGVVHQPVPCMHCENAPCELVCPVGATVHSSEGLNEMVYNRCVGTRYCSNNCPYKVRRFNFYNFNAKNSPSEKLMKNPDVTVRSRGVMEKCSYCVQRIDAARIDSEKAGRKLKDGDVVTACQAVCPADAIVFGDINDRESRVARDKADPLNYGILTELNTRPRTTYWASLKNLNPEINSP